EGGQARGADPAPVVPGPAEGGAVSLLRLRPGFGFRTITRFTTSTQPRKDTPQRMSVAKEDRKAVKAKFARTGTDTGSTEVQVALLSQRIRNLTGHLGGHKKDFAGRRGL